MPPLTRVVSELHRLAQPPESDAELLDRFVRCRDQAAFTALVERHGPMVLRQCRRVLGDAHAAEDVLQATFLKLARKAATLPRPAGLASWLYTVAQHIAFKVHRADRRLRLCPLATEPADPSGDPLSALTARELLVVLEEELQRLPAAHRMAVVTCCLEGHSRDEAAALLGCTTGALRGWLERGRARLHARLLKRGITLTVALAAAEAARGSVDAALLASVVRAALGTASATVVRLAAGGTLCRAPVVLVMALVLGGAVLWLMPAGGPVADDPQPPAKAAEPAQMTAHTDAHGDALPPEAIARIGLARFRSAYYRDGPFYADGDKTIIDIAGGGQSDTVVQFWDADTGKLRRTVAPQMGATWLHAIAPDGKTLYLFGRKATTALDARTGKELWRRPDASDWYPLCWPLLPDGAAVTYSRSQRMVHVVDLATGKDRHQWRPAVEPVHACITPDARVLAIASDCDGTIRFMDVATGAQRGELRTAFHELLSVALTPDGATALVHGTITGGLQSRLRIWDVKTGKERSRLAGEGAYRSWKLRSVFTPDSRHVILPCGRHLVLHEVATGKEVRRFDTAWGCSGFVISRDGKTLLAGGCNGAFTQWDIATGTLLPASADPVGTFDGLRFIAAGQQLLTVSERHIAYDWRTGNVVRRYDDAPPRHPFEHARRFTSAVSDDGLLLAAPGADGKSLIVSHAATGKRLHLLTGMQQPLVQTLFAPDGKRLFASEPGRVHIWDVATGKDLHVLPAAPALCLAADGRWLATAPEKRTDGPPTIVIWNVATGQLVSKIRTPWVSVNALAFVPGGPNLVASGNVPDQNPNGLGEVALFDFATGSAVKTLRRAGPAVHFIACSPDGRTFVTGDHGERSVPLLEMATGQVRHQFNGHAKSPLAVAFSPDGSLLGAASEDAPLFLWDVYGKHGKPAAREHWATADKARLLEQLAGPDAKAGFQAVRRLVRQPAATVALLREKLRPAGPIDGKQLKRWISDLDSADFAVRQTASAELERLGDRIEGQLHDVLARDGSLEAKRRIEALVAKAAVPTPERLACWRALEALEQIATPDAARLLETLAAGDPAARLTREAAAGRERLDRLGRR